MWWYWWRSVFFTTSSQLFSNARPGQKRATLGYAARRPARGSDTLRWLLRIVDRALAGGRRPFLHCASGRGNARRPGRRTTVTTCARARSKPPRRACPERAKPYKCFPQGRSCRPRVAWCAHGHQRTAATTSCSRSANKVKAIPASNRPADDRFAHLSARPPLGWSGSAL